MMQKKDNLLLKDLLKALDAWAPFAWQEDYDNAGLILGNADQRVERVLVCFDLTLAVVREAIEKKADVIVSHHPPIFRGIKRIDSESHFGCMLKLSLENNIAWVAMHTNLDNTFTGVNSYLRLRLGLRNAHPLLPFTNARGADPQQDWHEAGAGVIGTLEEPLSATDFLHKIKMLTGAACIRHSGLPRKKIKTVALCGGAGSSFIKDAARLKADVYVTGDLKYHDFTDCPPRLWLCDIGHFESESFAQKIIYDHIKKNFPTFAVLISEQSVNPVKYY